MPPETTSKAPSSLRVGIVFLIAIVGLYLVRWIPWVDSSVIVPFTHGIASLTRIMLGWTGAEVGQNGTLVSFNGASLNILEECNGVPAIIVLVSAILAYPASWIRKAQGLALGIPAIFAINQIRVLSLFFIHRYMSPQLFELMHEYVWQFVVILFSILLWIYWAERFVRGPRSQDPAPGSAMPDVPGASVPPVDRDE